MRQLEGAEAKGGNNSLLQSGIRSRANQALSLNEVISFLVSNMTVTTRVEAVL